jgi:formylglycine-generating enzyme required for sulfatase activity
MRSSKDRPYLLPPEVLRDYSRARPSQRLKRLPRKSNFALFAQLFGLGAAFMLSFGYFSNDDFRQSVTNVVAAVLPTPPPVAASPDVKHASAAIDPFAAADSVVPQLTAPRPVAIAVQAAPPLAIIPKIGPPPPATQQVVRPLPAPIELKVAEAKPVAVVQPKPTPVAIPMPPLPKPTLQVAALKVVVPQVVAAPHIMPAAAPPPVVATVVASAVAVAPPAAIKVEKPAVVAQTVPPPVVQIPAPEKVQGRIEALPVPAEKTVEQLIPQHTQGDVFTDCKTCPELVVVAATPDDGVPKPLNANYSGDLTNLKPFAIGQNEITFDDWDRCMTDGGCTTQPSDEGWGRGQRPVIHVSFNDINDQYIPWLSRVSNHQYRLPSEAEWEFAVRGGSSANPQFLYSFGNDVALLCDYGNSSDLAAKTADSNWAGTPCNDGFATTAPVGSLKPNSLGIFDMHGNVWEWVSDCLRSGYSTDPAKNAYDCNFRVLRGGSWASPADALRSAERGWERPDKQKNSIGFRVARSLP